MRAPFHPSRPAAGRRAAGAAAVAVLALTAWPAGRAGAQNPASPAGAPADTATAPIAGVVRGPGGTVLVGAEVSVAPVRATPGLVFGQRTHTDDNGRFRLTGMPAGRASVAVRRIGYRPTTVEVTLPTAEPVAVTLEAVPQRLTTVVVQERRRRATYTGWMADFHRRRDRGQGRFITAADIDRRNAMRTTDLLRSIPGLNMVPTRTGYVLRFRGNRCDPFVWIDGAPASAGYLDVDIFQPNSLGGIEVYSGTSSAPVELRGPRGEDACGVIALWTRMPEPRRRTRAKPVTAEDLAALVASATLYTAEQVDEPARPDSTQPLAVDYPDSLRAARVAGEATVEFVVDTAGKVEPETIGVVAATHPAFARAVRDAVYGAAFLPAVRQGRRVRQLVQLPVRFEPDGSR